MKNRTVSLKMQVSCIVSFCLIATITLSFPQSPDDQIILKGLKYGKEGNLELAKKEFEKASREPYFLMFIRDVENGTIKKETAVHLLAAKSVLFEGKFFDATDRCSEAILSDPKYAEAYVERAQVYFSQAKFAPSWARIKGEGGKSTLMNVGEKAGREMLLKMAIADGEDAIKTDPKLSRAYNILSASYNLLGDKEKAAFYEKKYKELEKK